MLRLPQQTAMKDDDERALAANATTRRRAAGERPRGCYPAVAALAAGTTFCARAALVAALHAECRHP
jgi:hypothetical protein